MRDDLQNWSKLNETNAKKMLINKLRDVKI